MKILNNISPAFQGCYVHDKNMTKTQKQLSCHVLEAINYSDEYKYADESNLDVYIVPDKNSKAVSVRYMDKDNGYYIRDLKKPGRKTLVQTIVPTGSALLKADEIIQQLGDVVAGKFGFLGYNSEMYLNKNTDLAKVRPELYED